MSDGHRFKMKKIVTICTLGRKKIFSNSLPSTLIGAKGFRKINTPTISKLTYTGEIYLSDGEKTVFHM